MRKIIITMVIILMCSAPALAVEIYHYDRSTCEYIGQSTAKLDPLELQINKKEVPLLPAHSTLMPPPSAGLNEKAVYNAGEWSLVPDFRGSIYYKTDGTKIVIKDLGKTIPSDALLEPPPPPPRTQEQIEEQMIQAEMRAVAIERLKASGQLPADYK